MPNEGKNAWMTIKFFPHNEQGFTFLEISLVVLIFGMVLFFAAPRISLLLEGDISSVHKDLIALSTYLRDEAMSKRHLYRIAIDIENSRYWVEILKGRIFEKDEKALSKEGNLGDELRILDLQYSDGQRITEDNGYIYYYPTGFMEPVILHLEHTSKKRYSLIFHPLTAEINLEEGYMEMRYEEHFGDNEKIRNN